jgi:hypothetical protein
LPVTPIYASNVAPFTNWQWIDWHAAAVIRELDPRWRAFRSCAVDHERRDNHADAMRLFYESACLVDHEPIAFCQLKF